jgi:hypothetical protein
VLIDAALKITIRSAVSQIVPLMPK